MKKAKKLPPAYTAETKDARFAGTFEVLVPVPGRNDRCPCGSGKKFKHCHGAPS